MLELAFPTYEGQTLKPKLSERSEQRPRILKGTLSVSELVKPWSHRTGRWRSVTTCPQLCVEQSKKKKKIPRPLFLITDLDFHEFGAWIYTTTAAGRKRWNVSLNWFQLGDTLRHLTEANSNFLWKKIPLNGASMNSYTLSYKEKDLFSFFFCH